MKGLAYIEAHGYRIAPRDFRVRPGFGGVWMVTDGKRFAVVGNDPEELIRYTCRWLPAACY